MNSYLTIAKLISTLKLGGELIFTLESTTSEFETTEFILDQEAFRRFAYGISQAKDLITFSNTELICFTQGKGYVSPKTGQIVDYHYCVLRRVSL